MPCYLLVWIVEPGGVPAIIVKIIGLKCDGLYNNSLTIVFFLFFVVSFAGQVFTGMNWYNKEQQEEGHSPVTLSKYLTTGHFLESTFENWESEFLQMAFFVVFTIWLYQKGSSESKKFEEGEEVDREPDPNREGAPWPVRKGGLILAIYKHSLTITNCSCFVKILSRQLRKHAH